MYPFKINPRYQEKIEYWVGQVVINQAVRMGNKTVEERYGDEQISADLTAHDIYNQGIWNLRRETEEDYSFVSEEGSEVYGNRERVGITFVGDPIDGSSEFNRIGPMRSPLTTAILSIKNREIVAASVGDIWNMKIYGVDDTGLYVREMNTSSKRYLKVSPEKGSLALRNAMVAAYAPTKERMSLIYPELFNAAQYVHNNGGQPFAIHVVEGEGTRTYSVALEIKPVGLWEHIGPLMAIRGNAFVRRLDNELLELDPSIKQTSVTAASESLGNEVIKILNKTFE